MLLGVGWDSSTKWATGWSISIGCISSIFIQQIVVKNVTASTEQNDFIQLLANKKDNSCNKGDNSVI
jgi:hypothetical protein